MSAHSGPGFRPPPAHTARVGEEEGGQPASRAPELHQFGRVHLPLAAQSRVLKNQHGDRCARERWAAVRSPVTIGKDVDVAKLRYDLEDASFGTLLPTRRRKTHLGEA